MANVDETLCVERHQKLEETCCEIKSNVKDLHDVIYKNGFIGKISRIDAMNKVNMSITLMILASVIGLSVYAFKEISEFKKEGPYVITNTCENSK